MLSQIVPGDCVTNLWHLFCKIWEVDSQVGSNERCYQFVFQEPLPGTKNTSWLLFAATSMVNVWLSLGNLNYLVTVRERWQLWLNKANNSVSA